MWQVMQAHRQRLIRMQLPGLDSGLCFPSRAGGYRLAFLPVVLLAADHLQEYGADLLC